MDKEVRTGLGGLSGGSVVAMVVLAAGALWLRGAPLEGSRPPANEPRLEQRFSTQDVDARLWQDPFGAIARARDDAVRKHGAAKARTDEQALHTAALLAKTVEAKAADGVEQVVVFAVLLPGGPYSENVESRRRTRYAVLAGLNASGFVPLDTEHLGYFLPQQPSADALHGKAPEIVPYEWFEPASERQSTANDRAKGFKPQVLVLWLDEGAFHEKPFQRLHELARAIGSSGSTTDGVSSGGPRVLWQVLGPGGSEGLKAMVDEAMPVADPAHPALPGMRFMFYSPAATVPDDTLLESRSGATAGSNLSLFFAQQRIRLVRTIGDDRRLAAALIDELELRGLHARRLPSSDNSAGARPYDEICANETTRAPSHIAVVAEWDTLYGRSMRRHFKASGVAEGFCAHRFNYVRGLDGHLPESAPAAQAPRAREASKTSKDDDRRNDGSFIERAEGQSQFDYLRRLAARMREKDQELRRAGGEGLRAIGVLGNDVHDKLLVLQALQPAFPHAVFFTTDLDARLLHPREQPWARNLVVASNFGLRLEDGLQAGTPPFRDSYQTSAFFSTRLALHDARRTMVNAPDEPVSQWRIDQWFGRPRIFEVGRTTAFDFSGARPATRAEDRSSPDGPSWISAARASPRDMRANSRCRGSELIECADIHPHGSRMYPDPGLAKVAVIASLIVLALWAPLLALGRSTRRRVRRFVARGGDPAGRAARRVVLGASVVLLQVVLPLLIAAAWAPFAAWLTRDGKPLVFTEGISIWPTEAIRLFTLMLCIYLVARGWSALARNLDEISLGLRLGRTRRRLVAEQRCVDRALEWRHKLVNMFCVRFVGPRRAGAETVSELSDGASAFWRRYIVQDRAAARLTRTLACVVLMMGFGYLLLAVLDESRSMPQRGELSRAMHGALIVPNIVMMYFLVFCVADATLLSVRLARELQSRLASWPERTLRLFEARLALPRRHLDSWIDLQFVALRTSCVGKLVYYPFIVLSLVLLSRSSVFDDWHMPVGFLALALVSAAIVLACAFALRRAAETSRRHALKEARDALMQVSVRQPEPGQASADQLRQLIDRIGDLRDGAFAPFSQQPLLRAALLPFATMGGTALLDYMALANL